MLVLYVISMKIHLHNNFLLVAIRLPEIASFKNEEYIKGASSKALLV